MPEAELVKQEPPRPASVQSFAGFGPAEYHALRESIGAGAPSAAFKAHLMLCRRLGLSPVGGQVHLVQRTVRVKRGGQWVEEPRYTTQIGIDGFRSLAEDHGDYDGQDEPEFQYQPGGDWTDEVLVDQLPYAARVKVYRKSIGRPIAARAMWAQFASVRTYEREVSVEKDGKKVKEKQLVTEPMAMWKKMPHHMLAKCAEAQALRKAFPRLLGGVYTPDEVRSGPVIEGQVVQIPETSQEGAQQPESRPARPESEKFDPAAVSSAEGEGGEIIDGDFSDADAAPIPESE